MRRLLISLYSIAHLPKVEGGSGYDDFPNNLCFSCRNLQPSRDPKEFPGQESSALAQSSLAAPQVVASKTLFALQCSQDVFHILGYSIYLAVHAVVTSN